MEEHLHTCPFGFLEQSLGEGQFQFCLYSQCILVVSFILRCFEILHYIR